MGGGGPEGHGLARLNHDLTVDWLYPHDAGLPYIADCYSLNLDAETAHFCPYTDFDILSASGDKVTNWGVSPQRSAHNILVRGADRALLGGSGPEYDVITLLHISQDGVSRVGTRCRIILPDGLEAQRLRYACRGGDLHAFTAWGAWYRTSLETLSVLAGSATHDGGRLT